MLSTTLLSGSDRPHTHARPMGLPYKDLESWLSHTGLIRQRRIPHAARFDDRLEIHLRMTEKPRARFHFDYEVRRDDDLPPPATPPTPSWIRRAKASGHLPDSSKTGNYVANPHKRNN